MANQTFGKFQLNNQIDYQANTKADYKVDNHNKVNQLFENEIQEYQNQYNGAYDKCNNEIICSHCLKPGHIIKTCPSAVVSYGLICYYQKQITVDASGPSNNFFNKRTRKQGFVHRGNYNNKPNFRKAHNLPKIKILKKNETLNHTLKNMLGLTSAENDIDEYELGVENNNMDNDNMDNDDMDNDDMDNDDKLNEDYELQDNNTNANAADADVNTAEYDEKELKKK